MPLDENLNARIRALVADGLEVGGKPVRPRQLAEKKMFGGVCFLYRGNMFCGADAKNGLMVRVGPDQHDKALAHKHARPMDFTGKPMKGFVFVANEGTRTKAQLAKWVQMGLAFAGSLPAK